MWWLVLRLLLLLVILFVTFICVYVFLYPDAYRLADYVRRQSAFRNSIHYRLYRLKYPGTLVDSYGKKTRKALDWDVLTDVVKSHSDSVPNPGRDLDSSVVIHLRLGDVIDDHSRSVSAFLAGEAAPKPTTEVPNRLGKFAWYHGKNQDRTQSEGYVKPLAFYRNLVPLFTRRGIKTVYLVSGSHLKTSAPEKSQQYIAALKRFFEEHGLRVLVRWNHPPDDDFILLSNAKYFVPGGGGFSAIATEVAVRNGGVVLDEDLLQKERAAATPIATPPRCH